MAKRNTTGKKQACQKTTSKKATVKPKSSTEERDLNTPIIQDLIAGFRMVDIASQHKKDRGRIRDIYNENKAHIDAEREILLQDRQEKINKALWDDVESMAELITASTKLLKTTIDELQKKLDQGQVSTGLALGALAEATKAFDKVHSLVAAQQKEATR